MNTSRDAPAGPFAWSLGGWFGSQLGSTLWLGILGVLLLWQDAFAGLVTLACCAVANAVGWALWRRRERLNAYRSIQTLLATVGVCALVAIATLDLRGIGPLPGTGNVQPDTMYLVLLFVPLVMAQLHLQMRLARRRSRAR